VTFDYDHAGRRVKMNAPLFNIRYLHDDIGVLQEYDGANLATTLKYSYGPTGLLSMNATGSGRSYYLRDALGSTSELTDSAGTTQASYSYDAWGKVLQSFDTTANRRRFTGHYSDSETGLHYFGARYYDDATGRFLSQDPFLGDPTNPASQHRYQYAQANPFRFIDPTGFASEPSGDVFGPGNPCHGTKPTEACNPATKEVDDYVSGLNEQYLARARKEGEDLKASLDHALATRKDVWKRLNTWQRAKQLQETTEREELLARIEEAAQGGIGDMATFRWMLLAEEVAAADPDSALAAGVAGLMHGAGTYVQGMLNLGAATGEVSGKLQSGQDVTLLDAVGVAGDVATILEPVAAAVGGFRQVFKAVTPTSGAIKAEKAAIQAVAAKRGLQIAIRATDPITAVVTRVLTRAGFPAKPEALKAKSFFGIALAEKPGSWLPKVYRSDLDVAWIFDINAGKYLDDVDVKETSSQIRKLTEKAVKEDSFQHGSHMSAHWASGAKGRGGPAATGALGSFGAPGPVNVFNGATETAASFEHVRTLFKGESLARNFRSKEMTGLWHTAWDYGTKYDPRKSYSLGRIKQFMKRGSHAAGPAATAPMVLTHGIKKDDK
jgi:RHS repeat-associated protein